jgi:dipeptidyl aminopeptidase/acylaminoacyl peptidase
MFYSRRNTHTHQGKIVMRKLLSHLALGLAMLVNGLVAQAQSAAVQPPPVAAFFEHSGLQGAFLSPSSRWLAITAPNKDGRVTLAVVDLEGKEEPHIVAAFTDADVNTVNWVNDDMLVLDVTDLKYGVRNYRGSGLFSVQRDGNWLRTLVRRQWDTNSLAPISNKDGLDPSHFLLSNRGPEQDEIIVGHAIYRLDKNFPDWIAPMRLNVRTGRTIGMALGAPDHAIQWLFDAKGNPRVVTAMFGGQDIVYWRDQALGQWKAIGRFDSIVPKFTARFVDEAGLLLVSEADSNAQRTSVLKRFDIKTMRPEAEPLVSTSGFDFSGLLITTRSDRNACGVRVWTDAETTVWYAPQMRAVQEQVDATLPGRINRLGTNSCKDPQVVVVSSYSDHVPGEYLIYRPAKKEWQTIGKGYPAIDPRSSANLDFHRTKTRDGLDLPVWVTTPNGQAKEPRPTMVLIHDGPFARSDFWIWYDETQFYASRGYLVIEPEFRGSRGFGFGYFQAGWKQWGLGMIDDIADATQWAINKGWSDPKRICVSGAGYGGYATLMSLARYPELYRCGIAWAAVTDLNLWLTSSESELREEFRIYSAPKLVGDPDKDAAMLAANSPVNLAKQIKAPLLMAHGLEDRRVPFAHSVKMRNALKDADHQPEWIEYSNEGHGMIINEDRVDFWTRAESFLTKNLK